MIDLDQFLRETYTVPLSGTERSMVLYILLHDGASSLDLARRFKDVGAYEDGLVAIRVHISRARMKLNRAGWDISRGAGGHRRLGRDGSGGGGDYAFYKLVRLKGDKGPKLDEEGFPLFAG